MLFLMACIPQCWRYYGIQNGLFSQCYLINGNGIEQQQQRQNAEELNEFGGKTGEREKSSVVMISID